MKIKVLEAISKSEKKPSALLKLPKTLAAKKFKIKTHVYPDGIEVTGDNLVQSYGPSGIPIGPGFMPSIFNTDTGKWVDLDQHWIYNVIIDWSEEKSGKQDPWINYTGYAHHRRKFYIKKNGKDVMNPQASKSHNSWSVEEIVSLILAFEEEGGFAEQITATTNTLYPFVPVLYYIEIEEALKDNYKNKFHVKTYYFKDGENYLYPPDKNTDGSWTAMEVAEYIGKLSDDELWDKADNLKVENFLEKERKWVQFGDDPRIEQASLEWQRDEQKETSDDTKDGQLQTVNGIKVRIGKKNSPCTDFSPADSKKPLGNKQFDPYSHKAQNKGEWECNTKAEHTILKAIEHFVTMNEKISKEVVKDIVDAARESSPGEPLHPEDDAPRLYRGSSRTSLYGDGFNPEAGDMLKAIDWSNIVGQSRLDSDYWFSFKYNGQFIMKWPVSSWSDNQMIAAGFAKGGPALTPENARAYQFIYAAAPSAAKDIEGTFIDFEELYNLESNSYESGAHGKLAVFGDFAGYKEFDEETLLLGLEGGSMNVDEIYVNWSFLTRRSTLDDIKKELPDVYKEIKKILESQKPAYNNKDVEAFWVMFQQDNGFKVQEARTEWQGHYKDMEHYFNNIKKYRPTPSLKKNAYEALIKKWSSQWFENLRTDIDTLYRYWSEVSRKIYFESVMRLWNQHPRHPWYQLQYEKFVDHEKDKTIENALIKLERLKKDIRVVQSFIFNGELQSYIGEDSQTTASHSQKKPTLSEDETSDIWEEKKPWYKRWSAVEKKKGMRSKLLKLGANKFIPAKGIKNVKNVKKSKSPAPGAGVLEEESPVTPSVIPIKIR